jgi:hypothetical protein
LTQAIRRHDRRHLITVGMLPWTPKWGYLSGFDPQKLAPELDFISVHIYPEAGKVPEALTVLKHFAAGKPVVIEETFPLACSAADLEQFLLQSRGLAFGWIGHCLAVSRAHLEERRRAKTLTIGEALMAAWFDLFTRLKPQMTEQAPGLKLGVYQTKSAFADWGSRTHEGGFRLVQPRVSTRGLPTCPGTLKRRPSHPQPAR